ncbi:trypsin-like serine protease [Vibrio sp. B1Z05]|nr:trypsin-like serine protease [Vibrio sp. B1Z05]
MELMMNKWILSTIGLSMVTGAQAVTLGDDVFDAEYRVTIRSSHMAEFPLCSGTLIRDQWILTAAHCVVFPGEDGTNAGDYYVARPGELTITHSAANLESDISDDITNFVDVSHVVVHSDYQRLSSVEVTNGDVEQINTELSNDIALLRIKYPLPDITPATLASPDVMAALELELISQWPTESNVAKPENVQVHGWGSTDVYDPWGDTVELQLQTTSQAFYPIDECFTRLEEGKDAPDFISSAIDPTKICTNPTKLEKYDENGSVYGNSACIGDSGGALLSSLDGTEYQIGIVSGTPLILPVCGSVTIPSFHTKVSYFYDWINQVVDSEELPSDTVTPPNFIQNAQSSEDDEALPEEGGCDESETVFVDCGGSDSDSGSVHYIWLLLLSAVAFRRHFQRR